MSNTERSPLLHGNLRKIVPKTGLKTFKTFWGYLKKLKRFQGFIYVRYSYL